MDNNSSIESVRGTSQDHSSLSLKINSPIFVSNNLDLTNREIHDVDCACVISTPDSEIDVCCHPGCSYSSSEDTAGAYMYDLYRCMGVRNVLDTTINFARVVLTKVLMRIIESF